MIVTRQRRKPFPWRRLALPLIAVVLVAFALAWGPSRNAIANGPAAPVWRVLASGYDIASAPFHFAAQNKVLSDRNKQIAQLQSQIADMQSQDQAKDKKAADLQAQITAVAAQAASARGAVIAKPAQPSLGAAAFASAGAANAPAQGDLSAGATPDMRRAAQFWSNMEPENAAKVVAKLPIVYVARVFSLMSADSAGSIMDALPPTYVAQLTQEHPELKR
ncbi:MAG: hypothetical protein ABI282_11180 [Candidatus Baltobacteraceae bacterium]